MFIRSSCLERLHVHMRLRHGACVRHRGTRPNHGEREIPVRPDPAHGCRTFGETGHKQPKELQEETAYSYGAEKTSQTVPTEAETFQLQTQA